MEDETSLISANLVGTKVHLFRPNPSTSDYVEDILETDSDIEPDSEAEELELEAGEDEGPRFNFSWKELNETKKFEPNVAYFDDCRPRFNEHRPPLDSTSTPLDFFKTFIDRKIIDDIITETNRYALEIKHKSPKALQNWTVLTEVELWSFLGLHLLTGLVKKSSYKDYWSTDSLLETPIFQSTMCRTRFENILRSFHLCDNSDVNASQTNRRIWKLGSFLPDLLYNFENAINPGEFLCVDESLLLYKGILSFKQYMPLKRSRFGIKYFALVDCETKYLVKLQIYLGKSSSLDLTKDFGLGGATVISLLDGYCGQNHKVVLDNWFNSPKLVEYLFGLKTYCIGTVRKNRQGLPKDISNKLVKGATQSHCTEHLLLERWQDRREVLMLNSFVAHGMEDSPSTNPRNHRLKPKSVLLYNKKMGALDHIDQQLSPYESLRKSLKWYKKLAFHLIDLAVYNSYTVFKFHNPMSKLIYKQFLIKLIREILDSNKIPRKVIGRPPKLSPTALGNHFPQKNLKENNKPKNSDCSFCKLTGKRKATPFSCEACKKYLCINGTDSCFKKFHLAKQKSEQANSRNLISHLNTNYQSSEDNTNYFFDDTSIGTPSTPAYSPISPTY